MKAVLCVLVSSKTIASASLVQTNGVQLVVVFASADPVPTGTRECVTVL